MRAGMVSDGQIQNAAEYQKQSHHLKLHSYSIWKPHRLPKHWEKAAKHGQQDVRQARHKNGSCVLQTRILPAVFSAEQIDIVIVDIVIDIVNASSKKMSLTLCRENT